MKKLKVLFISLAIAAVVFSVWFCVCLINTSRLISAVEENNFEKAESAISWGAWINTRKFFVTIPNVMSYNPTPLCIACKNGNYEIVKLLVENDADINKTDPCTGYSPLRYALRSGLNNRFQIAFYLVNNKADINAGEEISSNAFIETLYVFKNDDAQVISEGFDFLLYLLENGADISVPFGRENTLTYAAKFRNYNAVKYFLDNKMFLVDEEDKDQKTALIGAAEQNNTEIVKLVLSYSPDKTLKDCDGKTAYDYAVKNGNKELAELLKP